MYFKRIELNGFKSFADPVVVEFTDGITCIVGPNGSGKSNISDAIRWVLGEQSPKMLRGGRMEEVIFAGTQNRKAKGMAEVTLVIDNAEGILPIDFAEVAITRRMYRSGESEYSINRSPCRLKDIRELIMDTGIGVEGYSIIGQGKISDIVSNKMESRREIFEEAAGIVKYRSKKAESERKLENASGNLDRVNDIVTEIEGRIGGLEKDSKKASEFIVLRDSYKQIEVNITLKSIDSAEEKNKAIQEQLYSLDQHIEEKKSSKEILETELRKKRKDFELLEEKSDLIRDHLLKKSEEISELSNKEELNKERSAAFLKDKERIDSELSILESKLQRERINAQALADARKSVDEESSKCKAAFEQKHAATVEIERLLAEKEALIEENKNLIFEYSGKAASKNSEMESIFHLRSSLAKRIDKLKTEEELPGEGRKSVQLDLDNARSLFALESKKIEIAKDSLAKNKDDLKELTESSFALTSQLEEARLVGSRMSSRKKLLEELENSYEGYAGGVRFIMKQNLSGIIGAVGDIITVPKGYEIAVETALGATLQNIVCKDDVCAKEAIQLLKKSQSGRLTFLPLANIKVKKSTLPDFIKSRKGYIAIASEKVDCPKECLGIVEYLLGRVVLCDSLEHAIALSKEVEGSFRFVTLEGEIINAAGAITGGSLKNNTGNILLRKVEIKDLSDQLSAISDQLANMDKEKAAIEARIAQKQIEVKTTEEELRSSEMTQAVRNTEMRQFEILAADLEQIEQRRMLEFDDLKRETENADKNIEDIGREISDLKERIKSLNQQTDEWSDEQRLLEKSLAAAREEETHARMAESNVAVRVDSAKLLEKRVNADIEEMQKEKEHKVSEIGVIEQQLQGLKNPGIDAEALLLQKQEEKLKLEQDLTQLHQIRQKDSQESETLEQKILVLDRELYAEQMQKHEADIRLTKFETQIETLKEKLWEEFEMSYVQAMEFEAKDFVMSKALKDSREIKSRMRELGDVNIGAIKEYEQVRSRYDFLMNQKTDIKKAMDELQLIISDMDVTIKEKFKESFDAVVENFESSFEELFGGGHAKLTLGDPLHPLESSIEIEAQPPGKKLQNINLLSGGEKTMTAIALMFAVLHAKPTPFCILDEVEAALDEANIDCFARYLRKFEKTQFALVTHQKATMEYADVLYGVTMPDRGISKVLSLKLGDNFDM
ncbi:MAG: chromosome segregation protein SMC [Clostridia bacterium]|nr:chromosome segregation protein SMC [Clostridia bacterium]